MLVHAVTRRAHASGGKQPVVTGEEFLQIQRIASYGAGTIEAVSTDLPDILTKPEAAAEAITLAYRWWTALAEFTGTPGASVR